MNSSHIPNSGRSTMAYQHNPGGWVACCGGNVGRIFPNYALRMWLKYKKGHLVATLYDSSKVSTMAGRKKQKVTITEWTDYPFNENIEFTIHTKKTIRLSFSLRIPSWCDSAKIFLNNKKLAFPPIDKGFIILKYVFRPGDRILLRLPMKTKFTYWPQNGIAIENGPLVFVLPIKEQRSPVFLKDYSTKRFPCWNSFPGSAWQYGLKVPSDAMVAQHIKITRKPVNDDPWQNPPVSIQLSAKYINGWGLAQDLNNSSVQFSPPLPDISRHINLPDTVVRPNEINYRDFLPKSQVIKTVQVSDTATNIILVPYGATNLRISIFPLL